MTMPAGIDARTLTSELAIKVDGGELDSATRAQIVDVTVDQNVALPDTFAIRVLDMEPQMGQADQKLFSLLDANYFPIGADIEIAFGRESAAASVFKGAVTALEVDAAAPGRPILTIRGYDRSYRLHRARRTRAFVNQKDSDIAGKIASDHGLFLATSDTGRVYPNLLQDNQTDLEFLVGRARRIGFEVFVADRTLCFRAPIASGSIPDLVFGQTLTHVRLRMSAVHQVDQVLVHGWNPQRKEAVVGLADRADGPSAQRTTLGEQGPTTSRERIGASSLVLTGMNAPLQEEASALAQAALERVAGAFMRIEATCLGDAAIRPGRAVNVSGIGARFSGSYYATSVQHRFTPDVGYMSTVTIGGNQPTTLGALLGGHGNNSVRPESHQTGGYSGVVVALVTNNHSPSGAMVKVKYPWLPEGPESGWIRMASPMAGDGRGFYWLPEVHDEVLVAFEHGDIERPYVIGAVWNGQDTPPAVADEVVAPDGRVNKRIIKSRLGHTIVIDDSPESPGIRIVDKAGNVLNLDSTSNTLSFTVLGDINLQATNRISLSGREIALNADDRVLLTSPETGIPENRHG